MPHPVVHVARRLIPSAGVLVVAAALLSACGTTAEGRQIALDQDARTCSSFGSEYGSRAFSDCMLEQQRRRDNAQLQSLEEVRLTSEIAREGQIMAERVRRERCQRDPDRRECRR